MGRELVFNPADLAWFADLSHDRNPLHVDAGYARRTPFGQVVVYGILGALASIRDLFKTPIIIKRITIEFHKPLFVGVAYAVHLDVAGHGRAQVLVAREESRKLSIDVEYELGGRPWSMTPPTSGRLVEQAPRTFFPAEPKEELAGDYEIASALLEGFKATVGMRPTYMHPLQLTSLLWASYFVGMELPGKQALFNTLAIDYTRPLEEAAHGLRYHARLDSYDATTSMLEIGADLSTDSGVFAKVRLTAANRPAPVDLDLGKVEAIVGRSTTLAGKTALVTGSSRGLGAATALGLGLHGADVIVHARASSPELEAVAATIRSLGRRVEVVTGNIYTRDTWLELVRVAQSQLGKLDIVVNNAFPPVMPVLFSEVNEDLVREWVTNPVMAAIHGAQSLLPLLGASAGTSVTISSEAARTPPREYALYAMAKASIEASVAVQAKEYPAVRFITIRPPRLVTDMTNGLVRDPDALSPARVVAAVLRALAATRGADNYSVVDTF